jgi:hypothetical protein
VSAGQTAAAIRSELSALAHPEKARVPADLRRGFLRPQTPKRPRTALRYAIEHFGKPERKAGLAR